MLRFSKNLSVFLTPHYLITTKCTLKRFVFAFVSGKVYKNVMKMLIMHHANFYEAETIANIWVSRTVSLY